MHRLVPVGRKANVSLTHGQRRRGGLPTRGWYGPPCLAAVRTRPWGRSWRRRKAALRAAQGRTRDIYYIVFLSLVQPIGRYRYQSGVIAERAATDSEANKCGLSAVEEGAD